MRRPHSELWVGLEKHKRTLMIAGRIAGALGIAAIAAVGVRAKNHLEAALKAPEVPLPATPPAMFYIPERPSEQTDDPDALDRDAQEQLVIQK